MSEIKSDEDYDEDEEEKAKNDDFGDGDDDDDKDQFVNLDSIGSMMEELDWENIDDLPSR